MAIITLSRGTYSGAKDLAEYTAAALNYKLYSREDLLDEMVAMGWEADKLDKALYKQLGFMERMNLQWVHYLACLRAVLAEKCLTEDVVYHGNQGHEVLSGFPHVLSIKCVADMEYRINAVLARNEYAIDRKEAVKIINRIDQRRDRWSKVMFGIGIDDESYGIVIDLSKSSIPDAFERIKSTVSLEQFQSTAASRQKVKDLILASKLRAKIALDGEVLDDDINIEINDGVVNIKGTVHSREDADAIRKLLAKQPEINDVEADLEESTADEPAYSHH